MDIKPQTSGANAKHHISRVSLKRGSPLKEVLLQTLIFENSSIGQEKKIFKFGESGCNQNLVDNKVILLFVSIEIDRKFNSLDSI